MSNTDLDCNSSRFVVLTSLSGVAVTHPRLDKIVLKGRESGVVCTFGKRI